MPIHMCIICKIKSVGRIGLLRRLSFNMPRSVLRMLADALCFSKVRYCIAAFGQPRLNPMEPKICAMEEIQMKLNTVMRIITGQRREDRVPITELLEKTKLPSVNRMIMESILKEMWMFLCSRGETYVRDALLFKSNRSQITTRSKTDNNLELGFPMNCFIYHGSKLWNIFPEEGKQKMSKYKLKMIVKKFVTEQIML